MTIFETGGPLNTILKQISGYDKVQRERNWKRKAEEGIYPTLNNNYLGR